MDHKPLTTPFAAPVSGSDLRATRGATASAAGHPGHAAIVPAVFSSEPQRDDAAGRAGPGCRSMRASAVASVALAAVLWGWLPANAQEPAAPATTGPPANAGEAAPASEAPQEAPPPTAVGVGTRAAETSAASASFLIEKIVVEGVGHGSEKIVAAETLLRLGSSYTEPQLREALQRVERLPFVVQADFSLRRGSERGRFELVTIPEPYLRVKREGGSPARPCLDPSFRSLREAEAGMAALRSRARSRPGRPGALHPRCRRPSRLTVAGQGGRPPLRLRLD